MTFFNDEDNFLEFVADTNTKSAPKFDRTGPIVINIDFDDDQMMEDSILGSDIDRNRPFLYHKFTNYAILEPISSVTGIQKLLKIDLVNSKLNQLEPTEFTKFLNIKNKVTKSYCYFLGFITINKNDFILFVDQASKIAEIDGNGIFKIHNVFFMNTRPLPKNASTKRKLKDKQDEIENLFSTYGYYTYRGNLSSRFGGSHGSTEMVFGEGRLTFGGYNSQERRTEFVANRGLHVDLDTCGCDKFKLDVIFGFVTAKKFKFSFGSETKIMTSLLISRRMIPKMTSKEIQPGINFDGIPGSMVEVETLFSDGLKLYSHTIIKGSLQFQVYNMFELDPMKKFQNDNQFDMGVNQERILTAHANYLKVNYGAALIMNMMDVENDPERMIVGAMEKAIKNAGVGNIKYKYLNIKETTSKPFDAVLQLYGNLMPLDKKFGFREFDEFGYLKTDQKGIIRLSCSDLIGYSDLFTLLNFYSHLHRLGSDDKIAIDKFFDQLKNYPNDLTLGTRQMFIDYSEYISRILQGKSSSFSESLRKEMPLEFTALQERNISFDPNANFLKFSSLMNLLVKNQTGILTQNISESIQRFAANDEAYYKMRKLRVQLFTWNVAGYKPKDFKDVLSMFKNIENDQPEIVVVGLQEVFEMKSKNISKFILQTNEEATRWRFMMKQCLNSVGVYNLVEDQPMLGVYCAVFASPEVAAYIKNLQIETVKLGILNMGNKGGVVIKFDIFETSLKFCSCHLASGQKENNMRDRHTQIDKIHEAAFKSEANTYRFWVGDFNFRLNLGYEEATLALLEYKRMLQAKYTKEAQKLLEKLLKYEQMISSMSSHPVLREFNEPKIRFKPTYKLEDFEDCYNMKKTRVPSWTDRIIYCAPKDGYIKIVRYDSTKTYGSDHRPVYMIADIKIKVINKQKLRSDLMQGMF